MGHEENDKPRMVKSPWFDHEVPFDLAAETGTRKAICEHSTIGIVVTTDGSVSDIPREGYAEPRSASWKNWMRWASPHHPAQQHPPGCAGDEAAGRGHGPGLRPHRAAGELRGSGRGGTRQHPAAGVLYEFPVQELDFAPCRAGSRCWKTATGCKTQVYDAAMQLAAKVSRMKDVPSGTDAPALECDAVQRSAISGIDLANGSVRITVELKPEIFYQVLSEQTGLAIGDEAGLDALHHGAGKGQTGVREGAQRP